MNEAELRALRMGLREYAQLNLSNIIAEGDSSFVIRWVLGLWRPPRCLANVIDEVLESVLKLKVSFSHVKQSSNVLADSLAKKEDGTWEGSSGCRDAFSLGVLLKGPLVVIRCILLFLFMFCFSFA